MDAFKSLEVQYNMSYWSRKPDFFSFFDSISLSGSLSCYKVCFVLFRFSS